MEFPAENKFTKVPRLPQNTFDQSLPSCRFDTSDPSFQTAKAFPSISALTVATLDEVSCPFGKLFADDPILRRFQKEAACPLLPQSREFA
jgi:hypothetical protein